MKHENWQSIAIAQWKVLKLLNFSSVKSLHCMVAMYIY